MRPSKNFLRTKVRADLQIWGTLFSAPLFSGLNQWFRPKTIWGTHQTGSQRSKRPFFDFFKIFFEKSWFFRRKTKKFFLLILFGPKRPKTCSRHNFLLFLWYEHIKMGFAAFLTVFGNFSSFLPYRLPSQI